MQENMGIYHNYDHLSNCPKNRIKSQQQYDHIPSLPTAKSRHFPVSIFLFNIITQRTGLSESTHV